MFDGGFAAISTARELLPYELGQRFESQAELGRGGMGTVYRVYDRLRRVDVALKVLHHVDADRLYSFKREFRALSGLVHPNLVTLYELAASGDTWYFTMELVEGVDFLEHVRPYSHLIASPDQERTETAGITVLTGETAPSKESGSGGGGTGRMSAHRRAVLDATLRSSMVRRAFSQLAAGIQTLHDAGKVHRDLKPSNVLVDGDGRVVVCDFGLVAELRSQGPDAARRWGTPGYMAPEQAAGDALTPAVDWYAAGVMLYEALTGRRPFEGSPAEMLKDKQLVDPPAPRELVDDVDRALDELCVALLSRDPARRPGGSELLSVLGHAEHASRPSSTAKPAREHAAFVGRERELGALHEAFDTAAQGRGGAIFVTGRSGMGKTVLCEQFVEQLEERRELTVLSGRCYEREAVPYKTLDAMVDALGASLLAMDAEERSAVLPTSLGALVRLFPSLARASGEDELVDEDVAGDAHDLRRRAFATLAEILRRMASQSPVVVFIDDLQWGDLDSVSFLAALIHEADERSVVLLATYRSEERATSPPLRALLDPDAPSSIAAEATVVEVGALSAAEAMELAGGAGGVRPEIERLIRDANGHPLLLTEILRSDADLSGHRRGAAAVESLLRRRIEALGEEPRALLTATAIAGHPMALGLLTQAAEIRDEPAARAMLASQHLIRSRTRDGIEEIETYHDRIRETAVTMLGTQEARHYHRRIARALEWSKRADPLALVEHWLAAGDAPRAGSYAAEAAARSERALAFDQAARHYRLLLELTKPEGESRRGLLVRLGDTLANAGALDEAAARYMEATEGAEPDLATTLRCRAAEELIRFGQTDEGIDLAKLALKEVGISFPESKARVISGVLLRRLWLRIRGTKPRERDKPPAPEVLRRIDACQAVAGGLSFVLPVHGAYFQTRQLLWSLSAGEPYRLAMAFNLETGFLSLAGAKNRPQVREIVAKSCELAEQLGSVGARGFAIGGNGVSAFLAGEFAEAYEHCFEGAKLLRQDSGPGLRWQGPIIEIYGLCAALALGRFRELAERVPTRLRQALERRDAYAARALRAWRTNMVWLVMGQPDEALREATAGAPPDSHGTFTIQHYYQLVTLGQIELYNGKVAEAHARMEDGWKALKRTLHLRLQSVRVEGLYMRARCALAMASQLEGSERTKTLAIATACARKLEAEPVAWAQALSKLASASASAVAGRDDAVSLARDAIALLDEVDMGAHAAAARDRLGALCGGDEGAELRARAQQWFADERVGDQEALVRLLAPGWTDQPG